MLRKRNKTGHPVKYVRSRSGSMLLLVLVIMAVAIILITSALTITVKARQRYYMNSTTSQARLTATSTAMTIAEAIISSDLKSSDLKALAAANGGTGTTVIVNSATGPDSTDVSAGNSSAGAVAPGLYNSGSTSYTNAVVAYYPSFTDQQYITVTVNTGLDVYGNASSNTQSVTLYLEEIPSTPAVTGFGGLVTTGKEGTTNNFSNCIVGQNAPAGANNYVVLRGNVGISTDGGTQEMYSDVVITNQITGGAGSHYYGNVIFLGSDASISVATGGGGIPTTKGMFFIGDPTLKQSVFTTVAGVPTTCSTSLGGGLFAPDGAYFWNSVLMSSNGAGLNFDSGPGVVVDTGGSYQISDDWYNAGTVIIAASTATDSFSYPGSIKVPYTYVAGNESLALVTSLQDVAEKYKKPAFLATVSQTLPDPLNDGSYSSLVTYTSVAEITSPGNATRLTATNLTGASDTYTDSAYYIDLNSGTKTVGIDASGTETNNSVTTVLTFDLTNNDITIYVYGSGQTLTIGSGLFKFINGGAHVGKICLMDSVKLWVLKNNGTKDLGIIGTAHVGTGMTTVNTAKPKPFLYIYGINNNTIRAGQKATIEGYIGLYGSNGTMIFLNGPYFYGRIESSILNNGELGTKPGSDQVINYCPGPNDSVSSSGMTAVVSSYRVAGYEYS